MEKLIFPVFKDPLPRPQPLSMEAYLQFVQMTLQLQGSRDSQAFSKEKEEELRVNVPFRLKS